MLLISGYVVIFGAVDAPYLCHGWSALLQVVTHAYTYNISQCIIWVMKRLKGDLLLVLCLQLAIWSKSFLPLI